MNKLLIVPLIFMQCSLFNCDFTFPDVKLEAFKPKGFRVSIPETNGVKLFAFHANKNKNLSLLETGEFHKEINNPKLNGWSFSNPDMELSIGDKVYYWVFIQHGNNGYRQDTQVWEVAELLPLEGTTKDSTCSESLTEVLGERQICKNQLLFDNDISDINWKKAHFIASYPDYEFCSYQKRNDTLQIENNKLIIKVIPLKSETDVRGILDLRNGCTSHRETDCIMYQDGGFILPPVISERMKTTRSFKYGKVEVRAKLPSGDWLYPEIYLQSSLNPVKKIWVAYARGNEHLIGNSGDDLGGNLLFGGPIINVTEPERSRYLSSTRAKNVFSSDYHTYSVIWEPNKISLFVDNVRYGESQEKILSMLDDPMHLVLGIGVGGVNDFPDGYVSSNKKTKPWVNFERLQMKKFFNAREDWLPTWTDEGSSLRIEHVKVWAL
ncbi:hypothetical protein WA026_017358 [Henosepilachna vigintioctopunctata]|uniref:Uncharacterized protein n=1 Tax=Henosepilachna vigintioctopunctata TaxID=420089 RepID=A0AAW1VHU6_9CUCU